MPRSGILKLYGDAGSKRAKLGLRVLKLKDNGDAGCKRARGGVSQLFSHRIAAVRVNASIFLISNILKKLNFQVVMLDYIVFYHSDLVKSLIKHHTYAFRRNTAIYIFLVSSCISPCTLIDRFIQPEDDLRCRSIMSLSLPFKSSPSLLSWKKQTTKMGTICAEGHTAMLE